MIFPEGAYGNGNVIVAETHRAEWNMNGMQMILLLLLLLLVVERENVMSSRTPSTRGCRCGRGHPGGRSTSLPTGSSSNFSRVYVNGSPTATHHLRCKMKEINS